MTDLRSRLIEGIEEIAGRHVDWEENLINGAIDSLSIVEVINFVETLGREAGVEVDFDKLINEDVVSLATISSVLGA